MLPVGPKIMTLDCAMVVIQRENVGWMTMSDVIKQSSYVLIALFVKIGISAVLDDEGCIYVKR